MIIRCFIFDLDGTIVDSNYDWQKIRREIGCGKESILSYLERLAEPEKSQKRSVLQQYEEYATHGAKLKDGIREFLSYLRSKKVKTALATNNSQANTDFLLKKFNLSFDLVVTRDSGLWKPSALPLVKIADHFQVARNECAVVGDSVFDVLAAKEAGISHIFIISKDNLTFSQLSVQVFSNVIDLDRFVRKELFLEEEK
ncbi:MAG: hypothetical protein DRJ06_01100 [Candidatus Aminicenantes bacterium]|nr:MAG: hypothetical protein DRJ06_01100 [Candidatus Aminicenantes bacterium]HDJ23129.1 HAD family hydrolase [Candidatus Aminicenantes bacterium]